MRPKLLQQFLTFEPSSGIILFIAAIIAMIWANSGLVQWQQQFVHTFLFAINDGLMAIFFLLVGLELKRGYLSGQLTSLSAVMLPAMTALGGMLVPAIIYILVNYHEPVALRGWSTPVATDVAFAVTVLTFFGKRVPQQLKLFLLALAIFDDIGAIVIIAVFYSAGLAYEFLLLGVLVFLLLCGLNRLAVRHLAPYLLLGGLLWWCLWQGGVHPTIAGVLLACTIPGRAGKGVAPLQRLERGLHPYVAFLIMPLFALANAGFSWQGVSWDSVMQPVVLGIVLGLFVGKQVGVLGFAWCLMQFRRIRMPENTSWLALYGVALLCGIGFTMSLFLGTLSFQYDDIKYLDEVRLGVILGSALSACVGFMVLTAAFAKTKRHH